MQLQQVDVFEKLSPEVFQKYFFDRKKPVLIKSLAKQWPAYDKWDFDFIKRKVGKVKVGVYNNIKSDAYTPINKPDGEMAFGEYLELIQKGPLQLRVFLFNIFNHAPELVNDFQFPVQYATGFLKKYPMLFAGGTGSITHMHFDIDWSHIFHTQFLGRKRVLLFDHQQSQKLYHLPFTVQSLVNFEKYYERVDEENFPALRHLNGFECILEHGDTLFMPAGYWHHMEYIESGLALSLRAFDKSFAIKARGIYNLVGMRNLDTAMKKIVPKQWYRYKKSAALQKAESFN